MPGIIEQMETRLQSRRLRGYAEEVWSAAFILMGLRYSPDLAQHVLQGVRMFEESTTYQWLQKMGALKGARKMLLRMGRVRFGKTGPRVKAALEEITDVERLEELGEQLLQAESWEELLGLPKPRRRAKA